MDIGTWVTNNLYNADTVVNAIVIGFLFVIVYDFYHTLTSAIFSFFRKD